MSNLFDTTARILEIAVEGTKLRHQVIVNNVANVDTPGFQSADLKFEEMLRARLQEAEKDTTQTPAQRIDQLARKTFHVEGQSLSYQEQTKTDAMKAELVFEAHDQPRLDGNTVDIDREMAKLGKNTLLHNAYLELLNRKYRMLKTAITGTA